MDKYISVLKLELGTFPQLTEELKHSPKAVNRMTRGMISTLSEMQYVQFTKCYLRVNDNNQLLYICQTRVT